ncbi:acyl carrier protein [Halomicroarcula sp. F13]|uniref:Acyl carrier protein n=1 Tax=Haloarcula rubra TaxID=2487747 RepID=A0AAW4PVZ3_9EURY|nr:acyl carrier protein [Halomicroarcula rubra]MBX0325868.1 acyl carrier protein [Halomicroarcula rubra]
MSDNQDVGARVESIVADRLRVGQEALNDETRFDGEALNAESLDMVEVAEAVEADIGVHVPDEDLEEIETVGDLRSYVVERA